MRILSLFQWRYDLRWIGMALGALGGLAGAAGKKKPPKWKEPPSYWTPQQMKEIGGDVHGLLKRRFDRAGKGADWLGQMYYGPAKEQITAGARTGRQRYIEGNVGRGISSRSPLLAKGMRRIGQGETGELSRARLAATQRGYQDMTAEEAATAQLAYGPMMGRQAFGMESARAAHGADTARAQYGSKGWNMIAGMAGGAIGGRKPPGAIT